MHGHVLDALHGRSVDGYARSHVSTSQLLSSDPRRWQPRGGPCCPRAVPLCPSYAQRANKNRLRPAFLADLSRSRRVGVTGFEPAASSSRTTRATKLRHTPWCQRLSSPIGAKEG